MSNLNLHGLVASVVRESTSPDPDAMVAEFVSRLDSKHYQDVIRLLARDVIREEIRRQRSRNNGHNGPASRKVDAAREAWRRLLDSPEYVPSAGWLFLRDANRDQVLEMAGLRREKSRELAAVAKQYHRLAEAMASADAETVSQLPAETLEQLLSPVVKQAKAA